VMPPEALWIQRIVMNQRSRKAHAGLESL
jgi:hypothetical protein